MENQELGIMEDSRAKKKRAPTALLIACNVCGAPAPDHLHFGGHCCYSCRAFFRRTIERMEKTDIVCRTGLKTCEVSEMSKVCSACRYVKCLQVGMSVSLLQGKRKKKDNQPDDSLPKEQRMMGEIPELERIPRYKNHMNERFSEESNPSDFMESNLRVSLDRDVELRKYKDPFILSNNEKMERIEDRMLMKSSSRIPASVSRFDDDPSRRRFDSMNLSMSDQFPGYKRQSFSQGRDELSGVIQGPTFNTFPANYAIQRKENNPTLSPASDLTSQPSVIQGGQYRSNGVIRSLRTSVIQQGPSAPPSPRLRPADHKTEHWNKPQSPPSIAPYNSSLLLRYESNMMKYQADLCKQRSKVLDCHAKLLEQQEEARKRLMDPYFPQRDPSPDLSQTLHCSDKRNWHEETPRITNHNQNTFLAQQRHVGNSATVLVTPLEDLQELRKSIIIKTENNVDEPSSPIPVEKEPESDEKERTKEENSDLSDENKAQPALLRKDIKHLFAELIQQSSPDLCIESTSFQSKVFLEADNLLINSPLLTLLTTKPGEPKEEKAENLSNKKEIATEQGELNIKVEKEASEEDTMARDLQSFSIPTAAPVLSFTCEEMDWVDKIQQTMAICTKAVIREAVYQAVIDNWRGDITHSEMLGVFAEGKSRQAYMHILIMSNLPYFQDLTSRSQRWLMKSAASVGMELMSAVFFFAHSSDTMVGQAETCGLETNFKKYIETKATYALKMPARNYETLYKSPWAVTIEDEIRHRRGQQLVGESLKGKDHRIMPLLYALAVYAVSESEIEQIDLPESDKAIIKKAQDHIGIIYRRFLKQLHGWKAATGFALSHIYYLSLLKDNVCIGMSQAEEHL